MKIVALLKKIFFFLFIKSKDNHEQELADLSFSTHYFLAKNRISFSVVEVWKKHHNKKFFIQ